MFLRALRSCFGLVLGAGCTPAIGATAPTGVDTVVLVSLDTTRADRLGGPFGNTRGLTPNLDAFSAESVAFVNAHATANLTSMSHAAAFTGRYPSEVGRAGGDFHLDGRVPTLATVLDLYGWQTAAVTSGGHLNRQFGLDRGFRWFQHTGFQGSFWHTVPAALGWLEGTRKPGPAFLFVHGYDAHTPYMAPAPFGRAWSPRGYAGGAGVQATGSRLGSELIFGAHLFRSETMLGFLVKRMRPRLWDAAAQAAVVREAERIAVDAPGQVSAFTEADAEYVRSIYDGAIAYQDAMFGELVAGLKAQGLYDRAAIVVFADHGEALGERGRYGHGESLDPGEIHVPLVIRLPGASPRVVDAPVSLLDVVPTLCELAGAAPPAQGHGHSLLAWMGGGEGPSHALRFAEGNLGQQSVVDGAGQLVVEGLHPESPYYADLLGLAALDGPAFRGEGTAAEAGGRARYRDALLEWHRGLDTLEFAQPASAEAVEEMRKNGYFTP